MLHVRRAEEKDSKDIFDWRNDELTRQMSHTIDLFEWDGHSKWFSSSLTNENRLLVVCQNKITSEKVAVVRFDLMKDRALISTNLSPLMRGKGKAKNCLKEAIQFFTAAYPKVSSIDAEIKSVNLASKSTFEGVEFVFVKEEAEVLFYEKCVR